MRTYTSGLSFKAVKIITKDDIIILCNLLNECKEYSDLFTFEPEPITEGGIIYKFKNETDIKDGKYDKYKTVRLCIGNWPWINNNVMNEWKGNNDTIINKDQIINTFLKSFYGAPVFTIDELKIWEECFKQIGLVRIGKFVTKKSLICYW